MLGYSNSLKMQGFIRWSLISVPYKENEQAAHSCPHFSLHASLLVIEYWEHTVWFFSRSLHTGRLVSVPAPDKAQEAGSLVQLTSLATLSGQVKTRELPSRPLKWICPSGQRPALARIQLLFKPRERAQVYPGASRVGRQPRLQSSLTPDNTARELEILPEERPHGEPTEPSKEILPMDLTPLCPPHSLSLK